MAGFKDNSRVTGKVIPSFLLSFLLSFLPLSIFLSFFSFLLVKVYQYNHHQVGSSMEQ
jgi:hypothetical protein